MESYSSLGLKLKEKYNETNKTLKQNKLDISLFEMKDCCSFLLESSNKTVSYLQSSCDK